MKYSVTGNYDLKWEFKTHPHLKVSKCGTIINTLTGRKKKMCLNGRSIGVWLDSKTFKPKKQLNKNLVKIKNIHVPF